MHQPTSTMTPLARETLLDCQSEAGTKRSRRSMMGLFGKRTSTSVRNLKQPVKAIHHSIDNDDASVDSTSSDSSSQTSSSANSAISAFHNVETPVFGILAYLEDHGAPAHIVDELHQMESQYKFTAVLKRAESYVERLVRRKSIMNQDDLEDVLTLFVRAWRALSTYAQDRYSQIEEADAARRKQYWEGTIAFQTKTEWEQEWLRQRQIAAHDPEADAALRDQLAGAMRFKIDCQKGLVLAQEWIHFLHRIQRSQNKQ